MLTPGLSDHEHVEAVEGIEGNVEFDIIYGFPRETSRLPLGGKILLQMPAYHIRVSHSTCQVL